MVAYTSLALGQFLMPRVAGAASWSLLWMQCSANRDLRSVTTFCLVLMHKYCKIHDNTPLSSSLIVRYFSSRCDFRLHIAVTCPFFQHLGPEVIQQMRDPVSWGPHQQTRRLCEDVLTSELNNASRKLSSERLMAMKIYGCKLVVTVYL